MNVIVFSKRHGRARQLELRRWMLGVIFIVAITICWGVANVSERIYTALGARLTSHAQAPGIAPIESRPSKPPQKPRTNSPVSPDLMSGNDESPASTVVLARMEAQAPERQSHPSEVVAFNWQNFVGAIGGIGALVIALGMLAKSSIERLLDAKLKELEERNKLLLAETIRRQATVYNEQFAILKQVLSLAYRVRIRARQLRGCEKTRLATVLDSVKNSAIALEEMLIDHRAIMPPEIFQIAHSIKGSAMMLTPVEEGIVRVFLVELEENFSRLDRLIGKRMGGMRDELNHPSGAEILTSSRFC